MPFPSESRRMVSCRRRWIRRCRSGASSRCWLRTQQHLLLATAVPRTAASEPRVPAVAAVMSRRTRLLAPVTVRVRSSPTASVRISPTVIARIPNETRTPIKVAYVRTCVTDGASLLGFDRHACRKRLPPGTVDFGWRQLRVGLDQPAIGRGRNVQPMSSRFGDTSYLARFTGATRRAYELDVRVFLDRCAGRHLDAFHGDPANDRAVVRCMQEVRG